MYWAFEGFWALKINWTKGELGLDLGHQKGERISQGSRSFLCKAWSPSFS